MVLQHLKHDAIIDWVSQDKIIKKICKERISVIRELEINREDLISHISKQLTKNLGSISQYALQNSVETAKKLRNHDKMIIINKKEREAEVKNSYGHIYGNIDLCVELKYSFPYKGNPLNGYHWDNKPFSLIFESKAYYELKYKQKSEILRQLNKYRNNFLCYPWKHFFLVGERLKLRNFKETIRTINEHGWEFINPVYNPKPKEMKSMKI
ncbi:hypothetical protein LCGC14_1427280 [marine sediment metagenome]|uniref:Uncharacterized protein n=1 Tax=marine sediment metagenome TaxID=412755 RepID=A0A0F9JPM7_9ZZZZ|nr:hypothetical protein [archaeon]